MRTRRVPYRKPMGSLAETIGFLGRNQWFPTMEPVFSAIRTILQLYPRIPSAITYGSMKSKYYHKKCQSISLSVKLQPANIQPVTMISDRLTLFSRILKLYVINQREFEEKLQKKVNTHHPRQDTHTSLVRRHGRVSIHQSCVRSPDRHQIRCCSYACRWVLPPTASGNQRKVWQ